MINWGVLGATASIAGLVMPAIAGTAGCRLAAVGSRPRSATRAAEIAARYGARQHRDYQALLDDPEIDAVYVALPNTEHLGWVLRALEQGKHVLVEKPVAMRTEDVHTIMGAAERAGRLVMEAFMYRFHPQQHRAAELLGSGVIGDLRVVRATFAFEIPSGSGNIRLDPILGGGATWDMGCYALDVARLYFGQEPLSVRAQFTARPGESVETSAAGTADFGAGRRAIFDYSFDYGPRAGYELQGRTGSITVHNAWAKAGEPGRITVRRGDETAEETIPAADHYACQVDAFSTAIRNGEPSPHPLSESLGTVRACAAVVSGARDLAGADIPLAS